MAVSLHCQRPSALIPSSFLSSTPKDSPFSIALLWKIPAVPPLRLHPSLRFASAAVKATLSTVDHSSTSAPGKDRKLLLEVKDLTAVIAETKQEILEGVNLTICEGEVNSLPPPPPPPPYSLILTCFHF